MNETRSGFLLTRSSYSRGGRSEIEYWLATDAGPVLLRIEKQKHVYFVEQSQLDNVEQVVAKLRRSETQLRKLDLKTFSGDKVLAIYSSSSDDAYRIKEALEYRGVEVFESDIRLHDRYLMERFIYGSVEFSGLVRKYPGYTQFTQALLKPGDYKPTLRMLSLDIECAPDGCLFSIGLATKGDQISEVLMIGQEQQVADVQIRWYDTEIDLLKGFCDRIAVIDPDLIVGWNIVNFDMRILIERAKYHRLNLTLGRGCRDVSWRPQRHDHRKAFLHIPGRLVIDGIEALKSATWMFPSFSLENVARTLLGRGKLVEHSVDERLAEIIHNFQHDKPALARYNLQDCLLVLDIFEHTKIIDYLILRSKITGLELDRAGGSVQAFTNLYLPKLHRGGYIAPNRPKDGGLMSPGGYVMDSVPGLYRNVLVLDFKSLYPSIIRTFKIDPMGLVEGLSRPTNSIPGFKGALFDRDNHFLPDIISELWDQRDQTKRENDLVFSQAIKIIMNSFYGVLGSGGCRFYDPRLASSITMRGHEIMQTTKNWIEQEGYEVIYGDTDSTFVALDESLTPSQCHAIGRSLVSKVNQNWEADIGDRFDLESLLEIEFETHFSRFFMPTIRGSVSGSKKRYAGLIIESETGEEKLVFKGLENIRTDWTPLAQTFQAELFDHVFHDRDPTALLKKTVEDTRNGKCDDQLIYRKQLRQKLELYVKNIPPQVKAARIADKKNTELGKPARYQNKGAISYVITTNGPEPIEYHSSPLDYEHYVDKQIKPIADAILPMIGLDFDSITGRQIALF